MHFLFRLGENLARAHVPPTVVHMVRCGRMTALANQMVAREGSYLGMS